ncbi:unnamed protein product [Haemonchus placei]|uniref:Envelope protein n=1 Tax=Haemonchus placei TaxID=6290 RepID=A0A0N4W641_HAEPC|nr:unnamed protein product [Haemonchus placei]
MQNVNIWDWDAPAVHSFVLIFVLISIFLICILCVLGIIFCRRRCVVSI